MTCVGGRFCFAGCRLIVFHFELMTVGKKIGIALVTLAIPACGLWFRYAPEHWMRRVDWPVVKVDDRLVPADVYIGNPTHWEIEAIALVHVPGGGQLFS
jgi:hypothetical protein